MTKTVSWSDKNFKLAIGAWSENTTLFSVKNRKWLRARPTNAASSPTLRTAGTKRFKTQPDALFVALSADKDAVDVIAVEHCGTLQNLADKRSRYAPSNQSTMLQLPDIWMKGYVNVQSGGKKTRKSILKLDMDDDFNVPIRHIRILYVLKNAEYNQWVSEGIISPHEYYIPWSSISSHTSKNFRDFLKRLAPESHYYKTPKAI